MARWLFVIDNDAKVGRHSPIFSESQKNHCCPEKVLRGGEGVSTLSVPERATITNMGAELGATTSIFPSDEVTRAFLEAQGRGADNNRPGSILYQRMAL